MCALIQVKHKNTHSAYIGFWNYLKLHAVTQWTATICPSPQPSHTRDGIVPCPSALLSQCTTLLIYKYRCVCVSVCVCVQNPFFLPVVLLVTYITLSSSLTLTLFNNFTEKHDDLVVGTWTLQFWKSRFKSRQCPSCGIFMFYCSGWTK